MILKDLTRKSFYKLNENLRIIMILAVLSGTVFYYSVRKNISIGSMGDKLSLETDVEILTNHSTTCENVRAKNEIAVWTFLTDNDNYAFSAVKLLKSIKINCNTKFDALILELNEKPLKNSVREMLYRAGWKTCKVDRIPPRDNDGTYPRFRDQFTKLALWKLAQYKAHIYFDSDTFVIRNIDELINSYKKINNSSYMIGVTRDIRGGSWQKTFNMGVFVIRPDINEFNRLIRLKEDKNFTFETTMSEQGFLNVVYENKWYEIGFENNANLAVYSQIRDYWKQNEEKINVIHFTMQKPWACSGVYEDICQKWKLFNETYK